MNQYIIPLPHNDPRLFSHVSQAFSLVDLGKRLLEAAKNGDVEEVKSLINNGAPFTTDWLGISPLHFASMNGHLSSCDALLRAGISRDARTKVDRTPLHLAAQEGHADIVELLLRSGADLCANDMLRMTALHWAAERGHTPVVQMLMRFGADANIQNKFEMTPLDIAENKGHEDARDAMLNTQYDMVSSVGRMAAINGDLVHANAYILTDEETLVPAAPPADEVTVTATNLDECDESNLNLQISTQLTSRAGEHDKTLISNREVLFNRKSSIWSNIGGEHYKNSNSNSTNNSNLKVPLTQKTGTTLNYFVQEATRNNLPSTVGDNNTVNKANNMDNDVLLMDANGAMDMIIVETPDGETLYVRQQPDVNKPNNLVILNSLGQSVHNPTLMAQVMDALVNLPESTGLTNSLGQETLNTNLINPHDSQMITNHFDRDLTTSSERVPTQTKDAIKIVEEDDDGNGDGNGKVDEDGEEDESSVLGGGTDRDDQNSLVSQLASFANRIRSEPTSICVEGMGTNASSQDLIMWCLCNGIFIKGGGYSDEPTFSVEFVYQGDAYTLAASYDSKSGTIRFYQLSSDDQKCD